MLSFVDAMFCLFAQLHLLQLSAEKEHYFNRLPLSVIKNINRMEYVRNVFLTPKPRIPENSQFFPNAISQQS